MQSISIIIPVYHESLAFIDVVKNLIKHPRFDQIIIVFSPNDNTDTSKALYQQLNELSSHHNNIIVMTATKQGRSYQMNDGAAQAVNQVLLFLHADTIINNDTVINEIDMASSHGFQWGRFNVSLKAEGASTWWQNIAFIVIAWCINQRSKFSKIATGDQAIFITKWQFHTIGGFANIALMEDLNLCYRLKAKNIAPYCSQATIQTSARRWQKHGMITTILLMWKLRFQYWRGADPNILAEQYRNN